LLLPLRIFLAAGWLRAGVEKSVDHTWWNGAKLRGFLIDHHDLGLPFFRPVMEKVFAPYAIPVTVVVTVAEIVIGLAIASGRSMRVALRVGVVLNVAFVLCGQVNPSAFYLVMEIALLFAMADGVLGVRPSPASGRSLVYAGIAAIVGFALTPYIRTIDPANVIADPAMMLVFLSMTVAATMVMRWIMARIEPSASARGWSVRCSDWAHARQRRVD
jgi:thiosulfate dehydrogenase [quinone] large subunit